MTDTGSARPAVDTTRVAYNTAPGPTAWTGWVVFAAFMMMMNGFIQGIEGLMALVNDDYYAVSSRGLAVSLDFTTWGWRSSRPGWASWPATWRPASSASCWPASTPSSPCCSSRRRRCGESS